MIFKLQQFFSQDLLEWAPFVTIIFLISIRPWHQNAERGSLASPFGILYLVLLIFGLILQTWAGSPIYWFALTFVHFTWVLTSYSVADNHRYLEGYWLLSIALGLWIGGSRGSELVAVNARCLIGLCFLMAGVWKILSPQFRKGSFYVYGLLLEKRFLPLALWVGGLTPAMAARHQEARLKIFRGVSDLETAPMSFRLYHTGLYLAWWTIFIEVLVAVVFLLPFSGLDPFRVGLLIFFVLSSYLFIPVPSFGYILFILLVFAVGHPDLRILVLGALILLYLFNEIAHLIRGMATERMLKLSKVAMMPKFLWTRKARARCLEKDESESWRLKFPAAGVSLFVPSHWVETLDKTLKYEGTFLWGAVFNEGAPGSERELQELFSILIKMKLLSLEK